MANIQEKKKTVDQLMYSTDRFVDLKKLEEVSTNIICSICTDVLQDPVNPSCGHTFCRTCLTQSITKGNNGCPKCRLALTLNSFSPSPVIDQIIKNQKVRCIYPKCEWVGSFTRY